MDCERFEATMIDELYGELDELTSAAAKRHAAGCARCAELFAGLRATRRVARLPVADAPDDLEDRILSAARDAQKIVPFKQRLARAVSGAGSWAMRPQTAMAALFLVMIGTSALFLRGRRSKAPSTAAVTITDRGAPAQSPTPVAAQPTTVDAPAEPNAHGAPKGTPLTALAASDGDLARAGDDKKRDSTLAPKAESEAKGYGARPDDDAPGLLPQAAAAPPPSPAPTGALGGPRAGGGGASSNVDTTNAMAAYNAGRYDDATRLFDATAPGDTASELWAARSTREGHGCRAAVARFDKAAARAAGTTVGYDAKLEAGVCYRQLGNYAAATQRLNDLLTVPTHAARARAELDKMTPPATAAKPSMRAAPPAKPASSAAVDDKAY
jgi:hypothetical protein